MVAIIFCVVVVMVTVTDAWATIRYVDPTAGACTGNYSISSRNCTGTDGDSFATFSAALTPTAAGDTIYYRSGTYTNRMALGSKAGSAGLYITISAYPGETVTIQPSGDTGSIITQDCGTGYHVINGLIFDGANMGDGTLNVSGVVQYNCTTRNHHIVISNNEMKNIPRHVIEVVADHVQIYGNTIHDNVSDCVSGRRFYGLYIKQGDDILIEGNEIYETAGGYMQVYPGPLTNVIIRKNSLHNNGWCATTTFGGVIAGNNQGTQFYDNVVVNNYKTGLSVSGSTGTPTDTRVWHNTFYGNTSYGLRVATVSFAPLRTDVGNNLSVGNGATNIYNDAPTTVLTTNRTTGTITDCTISTSDFRMKTGTNSCRDAGTANAYRPAPVDTADIGAYEQGKVSTALALTDGGLEVTLAVMTPGVLPTSAITGFTVACIGCTGTPVVGTVSVKAGSNNVAILPLSGLSASGTCTVTLSDTNATDSGIIGTPTNGLAQGLNTVTALAVTGCANTTAGSSFPAPIAHYTFNASDANDQTVNNNDGVVSAGVTFATGFSGIEAVFPTDATYRHVAYPVGASTNLGTTDVSWCGVVTPDISYAQKVVFSTGGNGTNQRFYLGWVTVSGQKQWGIGVGNSAFNGSEFPISAQPTLVCIVNDSATDTVYLEVNKVRGAISGKSVKTHSGHTTTANNFRIGNDGTYTVNNGGYTVDEPRLWNVALSHADIVALYDALFTSSSGSPCYSQSHVQYEGVYLDGGSPHVFTPTGSGMEVVKDGGVALKIQITCTGSAGSSISIAPYYSTDGVTYALRIPSAMGTDLISMWGDASSAGLNNGLSTGCINATGLTPHDGSTIVNAVSSPTFSLSQNHCISYRILVRVGDIVGQSRYIQFRQDNGAALVGGYAATARIVVVNPMASGIGF